MNNSLLKRLRIIQNIFRNKIFFIRQGQIASAKEKAENAEYEWRVYISKLNDWKRKCRLAMCIDCERLLAECVCDLPAQSKIIIAMLRRIAKINPCNGLREHMHDEDSSSGPVGYRVCGKNRWDDAVRAYEEDH